MKKIAVIDMGSNTIKLLVASKNHRSLQNHFEAVEECRISKGISGSNPKLTNESIKRGKLAIGNLVQKAKAQRVGKVHLVATSAVRDASNGIEFMTSIEKEFKCSTQILTGDEEAALIARGLSFDPELEYLQDYIHFDLGGGSLECNQIKNRKLVYSSSMPLGAVRITEQYVKDPMGVFTSEDITTINRQALSILESFNVPVVNESQPMIFTGGSATISRALIHNRPVTSRDLGSNILLKTELQSLLAQLALLNFEDRKAFEYLPANRADVVCAAIQVIIAVMEHQQKQQFQHSLFALRHGIASKLLELE